jgi:type I restriction enzyme S subunit
MLGEWHTHTFADLIESHALEIGDGYRAKNSELGGEGPIFLRAGHVRDTHIDCDAAERFHIELADRVASKMSRPGDVIVTTKGNSTGRVAYVDAWLPPSVYSPHLSYWRSLDPTRIVPGFLRYWSRSRQFRDQLAGLAGSTDMAPYLSLIDQRRMHITLPPLPEQRAIAHILGTLDDKIELNRRMNETLESMARATFKAWFVDFDPVRAKAEGRDPGLPKAIVDLFPDCLEDSELGEIPAGWWVHPFSTMVEIIGGGTPKTSVCEYWGGGIPWFSVVDAPSESDVFVISTEKRITQEGLKNSSARLLPEGTTIISARGTVGKLALVGVPMTMNQSCYGLRGIEAGSNFTYYATRNLISILKQRSHGSVFDTITRDTLAGVNFIGPPKAMLEAFERVADPLMQRIKSNLSESLTLASLRDTLLPKLIFGELRIEDAERFLMERRL